MHGAQHRQVNAKAERPDQREGDEADRQQPPEEAVEQHHEKLPRDVGVELALAGVARAEGVGQLAQAQRRGRGGEQVEQDLEAHAGQAGAHTAFDALATNHEESAHRVVQFGLQHTLRQRGGQPAQPGPQCRPLANAAAADVATADHHVHLRVAQFIEHQGKARLVVLQVGVDHRDQRRGRGQHAFDARRRQSAPADAQQPAHARILLRHRRHSLAGVVRRIVIDEDHLPVDAGQRGGEPCAQFDHIGGLVEGGDDDRQLGHARFPGQSL